MRIEKIQISNIEEFVNKIQEFIDTSISIHDFKKNPYIKSDYFGEIRFGKIKVYKTKKSIIGRRITLKIFGEIGSNNKLKLSVKPYHIWWRIINNLILLIIGILLFFQTFYIGAIFIIVGFSQISWSYYFMKKEQLSFKKKILDIINSKT